MTNFSGFTLIIIAGLFISCIGCVSTSPRDNQTTGPHANQTSIPVSVHEVTPTECPLPGNTSQWIHLDLVTDHFVGEKFILTGTTNLKRGERLSVFVYQSPPRHNKKLPSEFTDVRGSAIVQQGDCNTSTWSFSDNLTTLRPSLYTIYVTAENATVEANLVQFNIVDGDY